MPISSYYFCDYYSAFNTALGSASYVLKLPAMLLSIYCPNLLYSKLRLVAS